MYSKEDTTAAVAAAAAACNLDIYRPHTWTVTEVLLVIYIPN
jgi:hypothetical protein